MLGLTEPGPLWSSPGHSGEVEKSLHLCWYCRQKWLLSS